MDQEPQGPQGEACDLGLLGKQEREGPGHLVESVWLLCGVCLFIFS